jgi:hypothetical protein
VIELSGKPGDLNGQIRFTPRPGFKKAHKTLERELVYGHYCPRCMNVVQALFFTDEPVDLWPYEETNVMSTSKSEEKIGTILKIVPNRESKAGYTNYTVTPLRGAGSPAVAHDIFKYLDFVIAGRFDSAQRCEDKPLCGSRNQQVHFLTSQYGPMDLKPNAVEILLDPETGLLQMTGFPSDADLLSAG